MKTIMGALNRRQFIKSAVQSLGGLLSFIILGLPRRSQAQSEKVADDQSQYICEICGYIYDPAKGDPSQGISAGVPFKKLSGDWKCPICGVDKTMFKTWS